MEKIEKIGFEWIKAKPLEVNVKSGYYCQIRDIFQARLGRFVENILQNKTVSEDNAYVLAAIAGEIGNNSFDHNLGNWPNIPGVFFGYNSSDDKLKIILADRGQGILRTLKKVRPEIKSYQEALKIAFTERISGRAPENRGNGLKFVRENVENKKMRLTFYSGDAKIEINEKMKTEESENIEGCLAVLTV